MASVASAGASPLSGYEFPQTESNGDPDENSWQFMSAPNSASPGSVGFLPSPSSAALGSSWGVIGHCGHHSDSSLPAASPLNLDTDQPNAFADAGFGDPNSAFGSFSAQPGTQFFDDLLFQPNPDFMPSGNSLLTSQFSDLSDFLSTPFLPSSSTEQQPLQAFDFTQGIAPTIEAPPWSQVQLRDNGASGVFVMEEPQFASPSPPQQSSSPSLSPGASVSPRSPPIHIKKEEGNSKTTAPIAIRKVRGDARVTKKKKTPATTSPLSSSAGSGSSSMFLIVTPDSVNAHADKSNPFDCHDAMRGSQRGRKGPLANETKESALKVRRLGACFHCHARKVKCEAERPCRNCQKLRLQVPQAICWQFDDFDVVLFPEFIRGHFAKDEMAKFFSDNIEGFKVDGVDMPCNVELLSGPNFTSTLSIKAKFFTAKTGEVLQHMHLHRVGNRLKLDSRGAVPIGLQPEGHAQKEELRKKTDKYIQGIVAEPAFAELVTDARHTKLPRTILRIVQDYAKHTDNGMVKRALSIYAMHYVMSQHLCLTQRTIANLAPTKLVPQNMTWVTPRVLNRQIKAVVDEMLRQEMGKLFKSFGSTLKPKERKGWAPCLAAFLVLCLFMESVETAADTFVNTENKMCVRDGYPPKWKRSFATSKNKEIENKPFMQVAFQFHQLYQTHSRDAGTRCFNPLLDDACLEPGELDRDAAAMVMQLRRLLQDPYWGELDFLTMDRVPSQEDQYPAKDFSFNYSGRLVAKFLLSFWDERYVIDRND